MTLVSFVIPTLNCAQQLKQCLTSVKKQTFKDYTIIIVDGGSIDDTLKIASEFHCQVLQNPLKTAEAGKAVGVKAAKSKYIALVDSDNILPTANWLKRMIEPLEANSKVIGSEPWSYTYRSNGGFIERYSSLTGVNDPYTLVAGNFDRQSLIRSGWTSIKLEISNYPHFQIVTLDPQSLIPTIGANGTIFRTDIFKNYDKDYLFDIDVISSLKKQVLFAKVKTGIIHTYCESSVAKFIRKQIRRATDLYTYRNLRTYSLTQNNTYSTIKFVLYTILFFPIVFDILKGYFHKRDAAWFFHLPACYITLFCYATTTIKYKFGILKPVNRQRWQQ